MGGGKDGVGREEWRSEEERWSREGGMEGVWRKGWGRGTKR